MENKLREELIKILLGTANEMDIHAENSVHLMVNKEILPAIQRHIDAEYVKISSLPTVDEMTGLINQYIRENIRENNMCSIVAKAIAKRLEVVPEQAEKEAND